MVFSFISVFCAVWDDRWLFFGARCDAESHLNCPLSPLTALLPYSRVVLLSSGTQFNFTIFQFITIRYHRKFHYRMNGFKLNPSILALWRSPTRKLRISFVLMSIDRCVNVQLESQQDAFSHLMRKLENLRKPALDLHAIERNWIYRVFGLTICISNEFICLISSEIPE